MGRRDKTPLQVLREHHGPASTTGVLGVVLAVVFGLFGFKDGWELPWVLTAIGGVLIVLLSGLAWWLYGGLVHACESLRAEPVAVKSRNSDDLDQPDHVSIFFEECAIAEQAKVIIRVLESNDFRVLGTGVLDGRQGKLSRVVLDAPAPGSDALLKKLEGNDSDTLKKLRVAIDHGYVDPRQGKFQGVGEPFTGGPILTNGSENGVIFDSEKGVTLGGGET